MRWGLSTRNGGGLTLYLKPNRRSSARTPILLSGTHQEFGCVASVLASTYITSSSTAQGGGGSFKNGKPIGEVSFFGIMDMFFDVSSSQSGDHWSAYVFRWKTSGWSTVHDSSRGMERPWNQSPVLLPSPPYVAFMMVDVLTLMTQSYWYDDV